MFINLRTTVRSYFVGIGQIMLQENAITGLLFLIGIFYNSVIMGITIFFATIIGTSTAKLLKYDVNNINKGLYGFNAALVGIAGIVFLKIKILSISILIIACVLSTILHNFFIKKKLPVYTLSFVTVTYSIIFFIKTFTPNLLILNEGISPANNLNFDYIFKGFGQVIFQENAVSGIVFFIAIFISSPIAAIYAITFSELSGLIAISLSIPLNLVNAGLFSYNALLCAIAFANRKLFTIFWVLLASSLSLIFSLLMNQIQIIQLTLPFVLACFIVSTLKNRKLINRQSLN
ncbi:MAG TPA: urea transporter [Chitinophagaceae bacterium]|nr:urea transporter [Chitinophagaceae bacterium]